MTVLGWIERHQVAAAWVAFCLVVILADLIATDRRK